MPKRGYKQEKIMLGVQGALILGVLAFYAFHAPALPTKTVANTVSVQNTSIALKSKVRKHRKPVPLVKRFVRPASVSPKPELAQFPVPTPITISISAEPQLVKMDSYQNPLESDAKIWDCVRDKTTGLVWEVKTHDKGLQDAGNFYSWYSKKSSLQNDIGFKNGGKCRGGIGCDTQAYVNAINSKKLCGYSDWRLPTRKELLTLVLGTGDGEKNTTIDTHYFPSTPGDWYWTADTDLGDASHAWYVLFYNGRSMKASMSQAKRVRLVRGGTEQRRSFKDVAEKKGNAPKNELAKQPFQPEPSSTAKQEMISLK